MSEGLYWMRRRECTDGSVEREWRLFEITDEMIERGARALLDSANPTRPTAWESLAPTQQNYWRTRTRAVFTAALDTQRRPDGLNPSIDHEED